MQLQAVETHETGWDPATAQVTLNITMDACFVPSEAQGTRLDLAHMVVLDNFLDEAMRKELLDCITQPGWDHSQGVSGLDQWEHSTSDTPDHPRTWGLTHSALEALEASRLWAKLEVQSRLAKLYPEVNIAHQPSDAIQQAQQADDRPGQDQSTDNGSRKQAGSTPPSTLDSAEQAAADTTSTAAGTSYDCHAMLANAALCRDDYGWHQDADPQTFPDDSAFSQQFGQYTNREPGKPLFVSLLIYLNDSWPRDWAADTLFLDTSTDTGVVVRPKPYRAVLMDQDITHRLSAPSKAAQGRPRYSLVWKLVFLPKRAGQQCSIARPEWGPPAAFGSAAKAAAIVQQLALKRKHPG